MRCPSTSCSSRGPLVRALLLAAGLAAGAPALGQAPAEAPVVRFDGFATLAGTRSSSDEYRYRPRASVNEGPGENGSLTADSRAGLRFSTGGGTEAGLVLQVVAKNDPDGDFRPRLDWAYVEFPLAPEWGLRLGRMRSPVFLISETLDVGYAHPWVRAPYDAYQLNPFSSHDGFTLASRHALGPASLEAQLFAGRERLEFPSGPLTRQVAGIAVRLDRDSFSGLLSYSRNAIRFDAARIDQALDLLATGFPDVAADYRVDDSRGTYLDAGFTWEPGRWLVMAEYNRFKSPTLSLPSSQSAYLTLGYRFGDLMPHLTLSGSRSLVPRDEPRVTGPLRVIPQALLLDNDTDQDTLALGLRWDVKPGVALKVQVDRSRVRDGSRGNFTAPVPPGARPTTAAIAVDVVF